MKHRHKPTWTDLAAAALVAMVALGAFAVDFIHRSEVYAQSSGSITGYAWSDTIGWLSFGGPGYGLSVAGDGTISGYAWSDNIGWVSANSANLSGCPSAPCTATIDSSGNIRGWLRALAGNTSQSGGWDGFISLSGSGYGPVRQSDGSFLGYAWGSTVVGWLDFRYTSTDYLAEPTANLQVRLAGSSTWLESLTISPTDQIELGWNQSGAANTVSCAAVPPTYNFSTGSGSPVSGTDTDVDEPIGNTSNTYRLLCYGAGSTQKSDSVTVSTIGGAGARFIPCPGTSELPGRVLRGSDVAVCWELGSNDPGMCALQAGDVDLLSPVGAATSYTYNDMIGEVDFTLECTGGDSDTLKVQALIDPQET